MDIHIGQKIGQWTVQSIIQSEHLRCLAVVRLEGSTTDWVMKITPSATEYKCILKYDLQTTGIKLYPDEHLRTGTYMEDYYWFVMEQYTANCYRIAPEYFDISRFVADTMKFLKYLHQTHRRIHGDLKLCNILYKNGAYYVSDYELITEPENSTICDESDYDNYYYWSYGAQYGKPVNSYRYDFEAVGYMLLVVANGHKTLSFQRRAHQYYEARSWANHYPELEALKGQWEMPSRIEAYFKLIESVEWTCLEPPAAAIYDEIAAMFA